MFLKFNFTSLIKKSMNSKINREIVIKIIKLNIRILTKFLNKIDCMLHVISKNKEENPKILSEKLSSRKPQINEKIIILLLFENMEKAIANGKIKNGLMLFGKVKTFEFCRTSKNISNILIKSHFFKLKTDVKFSFIVVFLF